MNDTMTRSGLIKVGGISVVDCILEVRVDKPDRRGAYDALGACLKAHGLIQQSSFAGRRVVKLIDTDKGENGTEVPCFGYNADTGEVERPEHVFRFFGITLVLEGEFSTDDFNTYVLGENARLCICGLELDQPCEKPVERKGIGL